MTSQRNQTESFRNSNSNENSSFTGFVRRVNMEPIGTGRERKLVCSAFVDDGTRSDVQVYTDNPRFEAALIAAYGAVLALPKKPLNVNITYVKDGDDLVLTRIDLIEPLPGTLERGSGYDQRLEDDDPFENVTYNRTAALAYARARWTKVSSDNYIGVLSSPGYVAVPDDTVFVRTTRTDPRTEVARSPSHPDIPLRELEDCAHFISCCIGQPPNGTGGGLVLGRDFPNAIYGRISARRLFQDLKDRNYITVVGGERISDSAARAHINAGDIVAGDLIFYYIGGNAEPGHAGIYLAGADKRIACHTFCRADQENDYNQAWDSVSSATAYTLAKVR